MPFDSNLVDARFQASISVCWRKGCTQEGDCGAAPRPKYKCKSTDFVDTIISNALHDLLSFETSY
jgi:hypothetical protein